MNVKIKINSIINRKSFATTKVERFACVSELKLDEYRMSNRIKSHTKSANFWYDWHFVEHYLDSIEHTAVEETKILWIKSNCQSTLQKIQKSTKTKWILNSIGITDDNTCQTNIEFHLWLGDQFCRNNFGKSVFQLWSNYVYTLESGLKQGVVAIVFKWSFHLICVKGYNYTLICSKTFVSYKRQCE